MGLVVVAVVDELVELVVLTDVVVDAPSSFPPQSSAPSAAAAPAATIAARESRMRAVGAAIDTAGTSAPQKGQAGHAGHAPSPWRTCRAHDGHGTKIAPMEFPRSKQRRSHARNTRAIGARRFDGDERDGVRALPRHKAARATLLDFLSRTPRALSLRWTMRRLSDRRLRCALHPKRPVAAAVAAGIVLFNPVVRTAGADEPSGAHALLSPRHKPAGVPGDYVLTHNGFFHPSCVVTIGSGETVGADRVIRGPGGAEHARFAPCAYPRYTVRGRAIAATGGVVTDSTAHGPLVHAAPVTYDGYIVSYSYEGDFASGSALSTQWTVPLAPLDTADQDIAFFNDILTTAGGEDILQPVLDYNGEVRNHWAIESEHCCIAGDDMQTTPIDVNVGDVIVGTVTGTGCDSTGVCAGWTVTTADATSGKSTTLTTTAPMGVPEGVSPGSLETYGVSACDMFPASGELTFTDNAVTAVDGGVEKLKYDLITLDDVAAEVPRTCGYGGNTSGNSYTLIFGAVADGGAADAGEVDASSAGSDGAAPVDGGHDAGAGTSTDAGSGSGESDATTGVSSSDAATGLLGDAGGRGGDASTSGSAAAEEDAGGAAGHDAGDSGDSGESEARSSSGCSCDVAAHRDAGPWSALAGVVAAIGLVRRRERRRTR